MDPVFLLLFLYYSFDHIKKKKPKRIVDGFTVVFSFFLSLFRAAQVKKKKKKSTRYYRNIECGDFDACRRSAFVWWWWTVTCPSGIFPFMSHFLLPFLDGVEMRPPGPSWNVSVWRCPAQWNDVWKDYYVLRTNVMREGLTYLWAILTTYYTIRNAGGCLSKRSSIRSLSLSLSLASLLMVSTFTTLRDLEKHWIAILAFLKVTQWLAWANNFGVLGVTL
jgi:hypothetical protein